MSDKDKIYTLIKDTGLFSSVYLVLRRDEYYARFISREDAEAFVKMKNGETLAVEVEDLEELVYMALRTDDTGDYNDIQKLREKYLSEKKNE